MAERIIIGQSDHGRDKWSPIVGEETDKLLSNVFSDDDDSKEKIQEEAVNILKLCGDPNSSTNEDTGLILGYVQSGKTLSFTTLAALARDNNYRIVIVLAGTSTNLVEQSYNRLQKDLKINKGFDRKWVAFKNPKSPDKNTQDQKAIARELKNWSDEYTPEELKKTILITLMKHGSHLANLISILKKTQLDGVPTLIIDDEGDQASMNTKASSNAKREKKEGFLSEVELSTIYSRIRDLKEIIPHHTFLQYTATPQAPLFINVLDNLSPNFIQLLTPGEKYTGGQVFFRENSYIVQRIPYSEIYSDENQFLEAPETLKEAMRIFFLGVTSGKLIGAKKDNPKNRSMMVHPSRLVEGHRTYFKWVESIKNRWAKVLNDRKRTDQDPYKAKLITEFKKSYNSLKESVPDLHSFEDVFENIGYYINATALEELNSKSGSSVSWGSNYSFILVGGQAMDRGFTVEGLTVTYMPRSKGVGNADTLQQRARFFGYKNSYLGYCRVYLDDENIHLYGEYVDHEEDVRRRLLTHKDSGQHLNSWSRQVVLNEMFKLTRKNILSNDIERQRFGDKWTRFNAPHDSNLIISNNKSAYNDFLETYKPLFIENEGHPKRTNEQIHLKAKLSLMEVYTKLFSKLKFTRHSDSSKYTGLKTLLELFIDQLPPEDCFVYLINKGRPRERSLNSKKDEINNLFQGRNPRTGEIVYPGDDKIKEEDYMTIQIHLVDIKNSNHKGLVTLTVWTPERLSKSLVMMPDNV